MKNYDKNIVKICNKLGIFKFRINDDCSIDVFEAVHIKNQFSPELPIKFNKIHGDFTCYHNQLTTLDGMPNEIYGNLDLYGSASIISLDGLPAKITGCLDIRDTHRITHSLENLQILDKYVKIMLDADLLRVLTRYRTINEILK